ncbi:sensor histidine kinase [Actinomadura atramentaria]|uniref:sensor histidine kinase n=1 Tax=Actinomadura atramentaria TaxID=1990 RepID=UPI00037EFC65|nr:sensor histidine kinase [Actinomadura atramentaria]
MEPTTRLQEHLRAPARSLCFLLLALPAALLGAVYLTSLTAVGIGLGIVLTPALTVVLRGLADVYRRQIAAATGERIDRPYLPDVPGEPVHKRFVRIVSDPATWRDLLWMSVEPYAVLVTGALPALLVLYGVWGWIIAAFAGRAIGEAGGNDYYLFVHVEGSYGDDPARRLTTVAVGAVLVALGFAFGPKLLGAYGRWGRALLGPTEASRLKLRVRHLTETRSDAVDASAAELRRIERDLHDGAQARLVAMGMSLGAIEHLLDKDPEKARLLLARTRESSAKALSELRDLVRGIHPPVLADRGLADAVRALALDHPLDVEVTADLPGRPDAPVESAGYFAVAEMLTNAAKHSGADRVWIDLRHADGTLRISVTDDGRGGATLDGGTGLRGVERRIGTFDGVLALNSPPGGPTTVTLELPCDLTAATI